MQLLHATARDELGFTGEPDALFNPGVNIPLGARYLAKQRARAGDWIAAVSAYNGGYRPDLGFGRRAVRPLQICLRRDAQGQCVERRDVPIGEFANQPYVNAVFRYWEHYKAVDGAPVAPAPRGPLPSQGGGCVGVLVLGLVSALVWVVA
jgi:hypothetical protein